MPLDMTKIVNPEMNKVSLFLKDRDSEYGSNESNENSPDTRFSDYKHMQRNSEYNRVHANYSAKGARRTVSTYNSPQYSSSHKSSLGEPTKPLSYFNIL